MTDIVEKLLVGLSAFVLVFALGLQGFHSYRMPVAQAQTDLGPDTMPDRSVEPLEK